MKFYEIALPLADNSGRQTDNARGQWERSAIELAGGLTRLPQMMGAWRDPKTDKVYWDRVQFYRVACDAVVWQQLIGRALDLFPDQLTIFSAEIGEATIHERAAA